MLKYCNQYLANAQTYLSKVDRQVDLVVLHAAGQWRTLPPVFRAVGGILGRVALVRVARFADVTNLKR